MFATQILMRESAICHSLSTPRVLAWFLGPTSSWNDIMDLLWIPCRWIGRGRPDRSPDWRGRRRDLAWTRSWFADRIIANATGQSVDTNSLTNSIMVARAVG